MPNSPTPKNRGTVEQEQFLTVLSREDALARFEAALFPARPLSETRLLGDALGHALAQDVVAPIDVPPFDRSNVDGFAVRSADLAAASEALPVRMRLNDEIIACGTAPLRPVLSEPRRRLQPAARCARCRCRGHGRTYRTRFRQRHLDSPRRISRTVRLLCRLRYRTRRGVITRRHRDRLARDRHARRLRHRRGAGGAPAAGRGDLHRRRVVQPGLPLQPAAIYDSNGAIVTAAVNENGGDAVFLGAVADDEQALETVMRQALESSDMLVLSGGTSKAPATFPIASSAGSGSRASSRMAWR